MSIELSNCLRPMELDFKFDLKLTFWIWHRQVAIRKFISTITKVGHRTLSDPNSSLSDPKIKIFKQKQPLSDILSDPIEMVISSLVAELCYNSHFHRNEAHYYWKNFKNVQSIISWQRLKDWFGKKIILFWNIEWSMINLCLKQIEEIFQLIWTFEILKVDAIIIEMPENFLLKHCPS